ncbi:mediator complex, subunit Med8 [Lasiosphaeria hispida]|uniref:Mediator of RNA polymerase II transcription subunit 8 n=1 Tax=Lasiosphaeria hispida TaxID=260671 RepID=A0AAJ0H6K5_9PEZI|nr:mediator complex, subunit Med8 [Lasiosphaeria hispida]
MASLGLVPEELKQLDVMRNRFHQLASSLGSLRGTVFATQPLPSRESLQASAAILLQNVNSIQDIASENAELFQRIAIHPSTNFPGRTQEQILLHLLRKKLEPDIESWVEEARDTARAAGLDASKLGSGFTDDNNEDAGGYGLEQEGEVPPDAFNEQWADIRDACDEGIMNYIQNQASEPYTIAEQEVGTRNVRTGLKRSLEDESDEDEEDEDESDEEMGGAGKAGGAGVPAPVPGYGQQPGMPGQAKPLGMLPEQVLWFAARGDLNMPPNIDLESTRRMREAGKRPGAVR